MKRNLRLLLGVACVALTFGCQSAGEADAQSTSVATSQALKSSRTTQLSVDVFSDGRMQVADAIAIDGPVVLNQLVTSEFVYSVSSGRKVIAAQPLADLFEERGIAKPGTVEEHRAQQKSARVLMYVPGKSPTDEDYQITVHRMRSIPANQTLVAGNFAAMAQSNGASVFGSIDGKTIAASVRALKRP